MDIELRGQRGYLTSSMNFVEDLMYSGNKICTIVEFLIDDISVKFERHLFHQVIGIPMGSNYSRLTMALKIESDVQLFTVSYDKRDYFNFYMVAFPSLSSNIHLSLHTVFASGQLIRYARCYSFYKDFCYHHKLLVERLLSQRYQLNHLRNSFEKFYDRYPNLVESYQVLVSDIGYSFITCLISYGIRLPSFH